MTDEEQELMTLDEAAKEIGMKKGSLYHYIKALDIEVKKYPLNKHGYISREDVERVKDYKTKPWKVSRPKSDDLADVA